MIMIGNLQYAWTLFVQPMMSATGWKLSEVQWGFTLLHRRDDLDHAAFRLADRPARAARCS